MTAPSPVQAAGKKNSNTKSTTSGDLERIKGAQGDIPQAACSPSYYQEIIIMSYVYIIGCDARRGGGELQPVTIGPSIVICIRLERFTSDSWWPIMKF